MTSLTICPTCQTEFDADGGGLCPKCLLRGARPVVANEPAAGQGATRSFESPLPQTPPMKPQEVDKLFPELEVLDVIGHGGMGVVYKARQKNLGREVAIKLLSRNLMDDPAFAERFSREARAMAMMNHPNIISIYDFGQRGSYYYLVMEYVDGLNLRQLISSTKVEPAEAMQLVPQLCDALQYAHDRGIVHRDIKPENVLITQDGFVKIADFGLAKLTDPAGQNLTLTQSRQVMGTLNYMAPEQVESPTNVDHRADIYSLGVVIYELLTGELPLGRFSPPSQKVQVDVRLDEVVMRALEKEPSLRYQQASEFKTGLQSAAGAGLVARFGGTSADQQLAGKIAKFIWFSIALTFCIGGGMLIPISAVMEMKETLMPVGFALAGIGGLLFALMGIFLAIFFPEAEQVKPELPVPAKRTSVDLRPMPPWLLLIKSLGLLMLFGTGLIWIAYGLHVVPTEILSRQQMKFIGITTPILGAFVLTVVGMIARNNGYKDDDED